MRRRRLRRRGMRRMTAGFSLGVGIGWRQEIDLTVPRLAAATGPGVDFVEVVAENVQPAAVPGSLAQLHAGGMPVVPHGVSLSLDGTDPLEPQRVARLAQLAEPVGSPPGREHVAFCRAGGIEAGHLLPAPPTRHALPLLTAPILPAHP